MTSVTQPAANPSIASGCFHEMPGWRWRTHWAAPLLIVLLSLALYVPGLNWGLPATASWSQDTIAGLRSLGAVDGRPAQWRGRYPPLHYFILFAAYQPVLEHWTRTGQHSIDPDTGKRRLEPPHAPKIGLLILIAHCITAIMAVGAALGVWAAARSLTGNDTAALLASLTFIVGADFTYFAHLGNVDVPSMCWFAWSVYFYVRAVRLGHWYDCALLGFLGSLAISTKDSVGGMYPGMAVVLLAAEVHRTRGTRPLLNALLSSLCRFRWLIGLSAFVLPYLLLNGVFTAPDAYLTRMKYWLEVTPDTLHLRQYHYPDQLRLLLATLWYAAGAVGWPMLGAMVACVLYGMRRYRWTTVVLLLPAVGYYLSVIAPLGFIYSRFLFPPLAMLCILTGLAGADFVRLRELSLRARLSVLSVILLASLAYAVAIDAEMLTDSRYAAERWFRDNVEPPSQVGAFAKAQYLPRLNDKGYATYGLQMARQSFDKPQPLYLILTSFDYEDFDEQQKTCMQDLLAGRLGYTLVATFKGHFLGMGSSWLSIAGWAAPTPGKISPTINVLKRAGS